MTTGSSSKPRSIAMESLRIYPKDDLTVRENLMGILRIMVPVEQHCTIPALIEGLSKSCHVNEFLPMLWRDISQYEQGEIFREIRCAISNVDCR
jgi:hypothetical protein